MIQNEKKQEIKRKREDLTELVTKLIGMKELISKNKESSKQEYFEGDENRKKIEKDKIFFPFIAFNSNNSVNNVRIINQLITEWIHENKVLAVKCPNRLNIIGDMDIMLKIKNQKGTFTGDFKKYLPKLLVDYLESINN